ncbi:MAG TPA: hypothetical protein VJS65_08955 [Verrucomicrobiae bacterium]|nr:hypothetical protein [Verrucomicrobiae bacterium]
MKNKLPKRLLPRMAGIATALLSTAITILAQSSPVGPWDVVLSGDQKGVAQITFNADFTISGTEVITARPAPAPDDNPRSGLPGRDQDEPTGSSSNTVFFGWSDLTGLWTYNGSGLVAIITEGGDSLTNGISLRGKRSGNRLSLVGHHAGRKIHYRGVPLTAQSNIMGNFFISGKKDGEPYVEVFNLTPDVTQNRYLVTGQGPDYDFFGFALLSGQNQLAISSLQGLGSNGVLSAVSGPFNIRSGRGSMTGIDETHGRVTGTVKRQ